MNIKAVIFDFDGTIGDTQKIIVIAKQEAMRSTGLEVADKEACISTIGLSAELGFQKIYPDLPMEKLTECVAEYRRLFDELKETMPPACFPNVDRVLAALKEKGIIITIATSRSNKSLNEFLDKWNLADYFSYVAGANDTELLKPNPEPVLKTLTDLSVRADQALVVGDMPVDIEMGRRAGVYTCGVTYGNSKRKDLIEAGADFVIDDIKELPDILFNC